MKKAVHLDRLDEIESLLGKAAYLEAGEPMFTLAGFLVGQIQYETQMAEPYMKAFHTLENPDVPKKKKERILSHLRQGLKPEHNKEILAIKEYHEKEYDRKMEALLTPFLEAICSNDIKFFEEVIHALQIKEKRSREELQPQRSALLSEHSAMPEPKTKRDLFSRVRHLYPGDDTSARSAFEKHCKELALTFSGRRGRPRKK